MDSASLAAKGGSAIGPNLADRGRPGTKRHLMTDRYGRPLAVQLPGFNRNDCQLLAPLLGRIPPILGRRGRPCYRPRKLQPTKPTTTGVAVERATDAAFALVSRGGVLKTAKGLDVIAGASSEPSPD